VETANIAVVSTSAKVPFEDVAKVAGAVARQLSDHVSQFWTLRATITPYASHSHVPLGYWRVVVESGRPEGMIGIHRDNNGQPYAYVSDEDRWTVAVSHEILEMVIDPTLSDFRAGYLPNGRRVNFLVEICDPCQSSTYTVNGVAVSDFVTPSYFDPNPVTAARYTFNGSITKPRTVAPYGYLVWLDPADGQYYAFTSDGVRGRTLTLGHFSGGLLTPREWVDSILRRDGIRLSRAMRTKIEKIRQAHDAACAAHAKQWIAETTARTTPRHTAPSRRRQPQNTGNGQRTKSC
jgi:hypothetical protein